MGFLRSFVGADPAPRPRDPADEFWWNSAGVYTGSGQRVTPDSAMTFGAVFACVRVIAESLAMLPLLTYERQADGGKLRATRHPLYEVLAYQPNRWQTAVEFWEMMVGHCALRGNAYAEIVPGPRGFADQLVPLHPGRMTVEQLESRRLRYRYRLEGGHERLYTQDEIFHIRGLSSDGLVGLSVVGLARETIGLGMAAERFGARQFGNRPMMAGVLSHPGQLSEPAKARLASSFGSTYSGEGGWHRVAVLEEGLQWQQIGMTSADAEFLSTRKFQVTDVARWFRVPPHMIGDLEKATFSNIEHQSIDFVTHTIQPWARRIELAVRRDLILATGRYLAEFLLNALLRGDTKSRNDAYAVAVTNGWMTRNEVRQRENLNPLPGLDEPLTPLNMERTGAETEPESDPETPDARSALALVAAERIVRREKAALERWAPRLLHEGTRTAWHDWLEKTYAGHARVLAAALLIDEREAALWSEERVAALRDVELAPLQVALESDDYVPTATRRLLDLIGDDDE